MTAEIINIGDELLIGQIVNTNASWIAQRLHLAGIVVSDISVIGDNRDSIIRQLETSIKRSDLVILTGGLGPTNDDITKSALCEFFDCGLVFNEDTYNDVEAFFSKFGRRVTEVNRKQAEIPEKCIPIRNTNGTAPGMWFKMGNKSVISIPGVPFELKPMIDDFVIPEMTKNRQSQNFIYKTILTTGRGESDLSSLIKDWENGLPENFKLAYLPQPGIVRLRLQGQGIDKMDIEKGMVREISKLEKLIPDLIFGYDEDTLENIIGRLLINKHQTLATAESCTGGYISHLITSVPGSSEYYPGSIISYSNKTKQHILKVKNDTLINHGAVSEETAVSMAANARKLLGSDYSIATTGIAGPGGGTKKKPVGTTWIAIASEDGIIAKKFLMGNNRERNIRKTALAALNMLRKILLSKQ
ncbi:MAG: competence/damage-inducible protein A [Bacteroidales bacterium]|nr:competence/damage-inducible protein A [Bacteroidales bacterium]